MSVLWQKQKQTCFLQSEILLNSNKFTRFIDFNGRNWGCNLSWRPDHLAEMNASSIIAILIPTITSQITGHTEHSKFIYLRALQNEYKFKRLMQSSSELRKPKVESALIRMNNTEAAAWGRCWSGVQVMRESGCRTKMKWQRAEIVGLYSCEQVGRWTGGLPHQWGF